MPVATSPSAMPFTSSGCSLQNSAIWSKVNDVFSTSQTAVAFGINGASLISSCSFTADRARGSGPGRRRREPRNNRTLGEWRFIGARAGGIAIASAESSGRDAKYLAGTLPNRDHNPRSRAFRVRRRVGPTGGRRRAQVIQGRNSAMKSALVMAAAARAGVDLAPVVGPGRSQGLPQGRDGGRRRRPYAPITACSARLAAASSAITWPTKRAKKRARPPRRARIPPASPPPAQ